MDGSTAASVRGAAGRGGGGLPRKGRGAGCRAASRAEVSEASASGRSGSGWLVVELFAVDMVWSWARRRGELSGRAGHFLAISDRLAVRENMAGASKSK